MLAKIKSLVRLAPWSSLNLSIRARAFQHDQAWTAQALGLFLL